MVEKVFSDFQIDYLKELLLEKGYFKSIIDDIVEKIQSAQSVKTEKSKDQITLLESRHEQLYPINIQLEYLRLYNDFLPVDLRIPKEWLDTVDVESLHKQTIDDLEILFVVLGKNNHEDSLRATMRLNCELYKIAQPIFYCGISFDVIEIGKESQWRYSPGIHKVRIDLTANRDEISVDLARLDAIRANEKLAGPEI